VVVSSFYRTIHQQRVTRKDACIDHRVALHPEQVRGVFVLDEVIVQINALFCVICSGICAIQF
jgi:hypothetical protein